MTTRSAVLYARKSTTDAKRPGKSVGDQLREARREAEARGWEIVGEFSDDGISASRHARTKSRPGFDNVLALIEKGRADAVVMAEQSRATRSMAVLGTLLELCADTGTVLVVGGTEVDPTRPEGFLMAGMTGVVDASESERGRQRTLRAMRGAAEAGRPAGKPVYGYVRRYDSATGALLAVERQDDQAAVVVEIIGRLIDGESVRSVTNDLNARGVPTATGAKWHPVTVRRTAMNPVYAGLRVHQGEVVGKGIWPALVTEDRHRAVVARLTDPSRASFRPGATKHLLSGTARCGECGGPLRVVLDRRRAVYACQAAGCYRVTIGKDDLDAYVSEAVQARLSRPDVVDALAQSSGEDYRAARDELEALQARKVEIGQALAKGMDITAATVALEGIGRAVEAAEARMRASASDPLLAETAGEQVRERWAVLTPEGQAALVRAVVRPVVERSTRKPGARGFDASRVRLEWRA